MPSYNNILFATDLSDESQEFAKQALEICKAFNGSLHLMHVIEPLPVYAYTYIDSIGLEKQQIDESTKALATLGSSIGVSGDRQILKIGQAKTEIIQYADDTKIDLIIVGSHLHHGLAKLLGSTANAISHAAHCDVLVIRNDE